MSLARATGRWAMRLALLLGLVLFGALAVFFAVVTVLAIAGEEVNPSGGVQWMLLTGVLCPACGALSLGCWTLFADSFGATGPATPRAI